MEERPPAENILNKQPRTNDKGWSSSLGVGRGANNCSPKKIICYEKDTETSSPRIIRIIKLRRMRWAGNET
jgi:hypothetical protein